MSEQSALHADKTPAPSSTPARSPTARRSRPTSSSSAPAPAARSPPRSWPRAGFDVLVARRGRPPHARRLQDARGHQLPDALSGGGRARDQGSRRHHPAGARRRRHHRRQLDHVVPHADARLRPLEEGARRRRHLDGRARRRTGTPSRSGCNIEKIPYEETNRNNRMLYDGCKALGLQVDTTRRNVKGCMKSGYCGMGCPVDAKQSMLVTYLPDAVAAGARVLSRCRVDKLVVEARQRRARRVQRHRRRRLQRVGQDASPSRRAASSSRRAASARRRS